MGIAGTAARQEDDAELAALEIRNSNHIRIKRYTGVVVKERLSTERTFCLALSDGNRWCFSADHHNTPVLDNLARIMRLKKGALNGSSRLIFCSNGSNREKGASKDTKAFRPFRFRKHDGGTDLFCEAGGSRGPEIQYLHMWHGLFPIYRQSVHKEGLAIHGALAELNGEGFLLVAPGGAGKSTCSRRFPDYWQPLCDDEALVVLNANNEYRVHPFPTWSDYLWKRARRTWDVQSSVPLKGLFFLEKATIDAVEPMGAGKTVVLTNASANQVFDKYYRLVNKKDKRTLRRAVFKNACRMAKRIPSYRLRVSLDGRFWEEMEAVTANQGKGTFSANPVISPSSDIQIKRHTADGGKEKWQR